MPESGAALYFVVPGDPVPYARMMPKRNGMPGGRMVQPETARAYQKHFATHAMLAARKAGWKRLAPKALVWLTLNIYRSARRADLSNFVEICEDAVNDSQAIWADDRYVVKLSAMMWKSDRPRIEVCVAPLTDGDVE